MAEFVASCQQNQQICNNNPHYLLLYLKNKSRQKANLKIDLCPQPGTFTGNTPGLMNRMKGDMEVVGEWQEDADNRVR